MDDKNNANGSSPLGDPNNQPSPTVPPVVDSSSPNSDPSAQPPFPLGNANQQPAKSKKKPLVIILAVVVALALAGGAYYAFALKDSNKSDNSQTTVVVKKNPIVLMRYGTKAALPATFYPEADSMNNGAQFTIMRQVFEGLVGYGANQKFVPLLATNWTNPDSTTWVFKLKQDVSFHNGTKMTADIVKASLMASSPSSDQYDFQTVVKSIDVVDAKTIKITTKQPDALFLNRLVNMFVFDTASTTPNSAENGTGPFTQKPGTTASETSVELVAYPSYHGDPTLVKAIKATSYDDEDALLAASKKGEVDILGLTTQGEAKEAIAADATLTSRQFLASGSTVLQPLTLTDGSPIQKLAVRQALYLAINPAPVITADGSDYQPIDQLVPKTVVGYNPAIKRPAVDVTKAKALLTEAGYPNGLKLSVIYGPPYADAVKEIGKQLALIGVTLDYKQEAKSVDFKNDTLSKKFDLSYSSTFSDFFDASDIINIGYTKTGLYGAYDNPEINTLLAQAAQEFDAAKRIEIMQSISKKLVDDAAFVPIGVPVKTIVQRKNYQAPYDLPDSVIGAYLSKYYSN